MFDAISVGHICVDLTPGIPARKNGVADIFVGGKLTNVGDIAITTGGSVSNTGIALNRLGMHAPLIAKIGDDMLGQVISDLVVQQGGNADYLKTAPGESSSYSIVLAIPGVDRIFLHNPGANDTFTAEDVDYSLVANARLMHFGYPTLMKKFYQNEGAGLLQLMKNAKETGATTSLDMTLPDPSSESGQQDWVHILTDVLPFTDIFMPSIEEIVYMIDRPNYDKFKAQDSDILNSISIDYISELGARILEMGSKIVVLKCGTLGYYVRTADAGLLAQMGRAVPKNLSDWADKELFSGIYIVEDFKSGTGAGDTSIAGFLSALLKGFTAEEAVNIACATGAICVTAYGAVEAIVPLSQITDKIASGWSKRPVEYTGDRFVFDSISSLYKAKRD